MRRCGRKTPNPSTCLEAACDQRDGASRTGKTHLLMMTPNSWAMMQAAFGPDSGASSGGALYKAPAPNIPQGRGGAMQAYQLYNALVPKAAAAAMPSTAQMSALNAGLGPMSVTAAPAAVGGTAAPAAATDGGLWASLASL